jgi:dihydroneopterin triphosphate diphosphatase
MAERTSLRVPRQVLVHVYRYSAEGPEFLLLRRTEQWGGFWQGVSGAPEWEESDADGAIREVFEETGFSVADRPREIGFRYQLLRESDLDGDRWERLYGPDVESIPEEVYVAEVPHGADPRLAPYEHDAFRWCSFDQALELLTWENNRNALVAARAYIEAAKPTLATP